MTKKKTRRTDVKIITKEAKILKYMRETKKLSMRQAAKLAKVSDAQINHAENGRKDLRPDFIQRVISAYGYTYRDFLLYIEGKNEFKENILSECITILKRLDKHRLKTVKQILETF